MTQDPDTPQSVRDLRFGLTKMNLGDQRYIFGRLPPELCSLLWKDRINEAISEEITADRKDVLTKIAACLGPQLYARRRSARRSRMEERLRELETLADNIYGPGNEEYWRISHRLGGTEEVIPSVLQRDTCDCLLSEKDCYVLYTCSPLPTCTPTLTGCGSLWRFGCDGLCL
jgi:hypothetical protein